MLLISTINVCILTTTKTCGVTKTRLFTHPNAVVVLVDDICVFAQRSAQKRHLKLTAGAVTSYYAALKSSSNVS